MTKLLWHSNAPFVPTGYGEQTARLTPALNERYQVGISAFYGLEGASIRWNGIPVLPGLGGDFGNHTLVQHARQFFGGDPRDGLVFTLCDVWPLDVKMARELNLVCWTPVDHQPAPPKVVDFLVQSEAVPIAMSRFGGQMLAPLDPLYVPHAVPCELYKPMDCEQARGGAFPKGAFVVGMCGANKGHPSRKAFSEALLAFVQFAERHENVYLYMHTVFDPAHGAGVDLQALLRALGIPDQRIRIADQYRMMYSPYGQREMAHILSALDVLLQPSFGEGFGVPVLEAAACGVPSIVTEWTAMPEVAGPSPWKVDHHPYWTSLGSWQAIPKVASIDAALEDCYAQGGKARTVLTRELRRHAFDYDVPRVVEQHLLPSLKRAEQRLGQRGKVVRIPSRLAAEAVAA
jgi:glycosyltransferase involved in cell wall biosynthesis